MIIGLTGTLAAGKGTVAEFFKKKGFVYFSLSDELREKAKEVGVAVSRQNLQELGNKLRREKGEGVLAEIIKDKILHYDYINVIVDGLRNPAEIDVVKKLTPFFLIAVDAPPEIRFERMKKRNRENDPQTWEDFLKLDEKDKGNNEDESGQFVSKCMKEADFILVNNGNFHQLYEKLEVIYKEILSKIPRLG